MPYRALFVVWLVVAIICLFEPVICADRFGLCSADEGAESFKKSVEWSNPMFPKLAMSRKFDNLP